MTDRNIIFSNRNTILWKDLLAYIHLPDTINDMGFLLNKELEYTIQDDGTHESTIMFAYLARSIIKLQYLGVLQFDFVTTLGTTSPNFIDRLHITFFGQKLLEYIEPKNEPTANV